MSDQDGSQWSTIASITYFSSYIVLLIVLAVATKYVQGVTEIKNIIKQIWSQRGIYGAILVHFYDTATDFGVMIEWYFLAQNEQKKDIDYKDLDMQIMFALSVLFLIVYRIISVIILIYRECSSSVTNITSVSNNSQNTIVNNVKETDIAQLLFDILLSLFDVFLIKTVYLSMKNKDIEPSGRQRLFESLPQIVLQCVFIVRSFNDPLLSNNSSMILIYLSIMASLLSITQKYVWFDKLCVLEECRNWKYVQYTILSIFLILQRLHIHFFCSVCCQCLSFVCKFYLSLFLD